MIITILKWVLGIVMTFHFGVVALSLMPDNPIKHQYKFEVEDYMHPFFTQSWNLFAPNPINTNNTILLKVYAYKNGSVDSSKWVDIVQPLLDTKYHSFWSPAQRVLKNMSSISIDLSKTTHKIRDFINESDSLKDDPDKAEAFFKRNIQATYGHQGIMEYAHYVVNDIGIESKKYDSLKVQYLLRMERFPRFSKRHEDYFDKTKYEISEFVSAKYPLQ